MGFYLLHESMLNSVLYARDKFLSIEGTMFPSEARIYSSPCSVQKLWKEQISFWDNVHGYNMSAVTSYALEEKSKKPEVYLLGKDDLLSSVVCIKTLNLRWMDVSEIRHFSENVFVSITKPGPYHGVAIWFECDFDGRDYNKDGEEFGSLVTLSTGPDAPATHWKQTIVMLAKACLIDTNDNNSLEYTTKQTDTNNTTENSEIQQSSITSSKECIQLEEDEVIGYKLEFHQSDDDVRHYTIVLEMLDPETDEHPEPCCCGMPKCLIIAKLLEDELNGDL